MILLYDDGTYGKCNEVEWMNHFFKRIYYKLRMENASFICHFFPKKSLIFLATVTESIPIVHLFLSIDFMGAHKSNQDTTSWFSKYIELLATGTVLGPYCTDRFSMFDAQFTVIWCE